MEIGHLVMLADPNLPTDERELLTIEYLTEAWGINNCSNIC